MIQNDALRQQWQNAAPNDCFIFAQLMQNPEICIGVLEAFLQVDIDHIEYHASEETIEVDYFAKGIRLDVFVRDEAGSIYNVEMQRRDPGNLPKRSRYYQNLIDVKMLNKGEDYKMLQKSFVIFICNFDPFDRERCIYRFEYRDETEHDLKLGDETVKLFFNTKGKDEVDPELREILDFFDDNLPSETAENQLVQTMTDEFYRIKANRELEVSYVTYKMLVRDIREEYQPLIEEMTKRLAEKLQEVSEKNQQLSEKDQQLTEKDQQLTEKDQRLSEKDQALSEKDQALTEKDREIERLRVALRVQAKEQV